VVAVVQRRTAALKRSWAGLSAASPGELLACDSQLPLAPVPGDLNGLRLGAPEIARIGMTVSDMVKASEPSARRSRCTWWEWYSMGGPKWT
jgi:hypothetical protein